MLQRVYGTAWASKDELQQYLTRLEKRRAARPPQARTRARPVPHRRPRAGPGVLAPPKGGWTVWQQVEQVHAPGLPRPRLPGGQGPQILDQGLWEKTGHWDKYRDNMFMTESEKGDYALKPMNCPGHILIFKQGIKKLPRPAAALRRVRPVPPHEPSGGLHGIMRVRGFTRTTATSSAPRTRSCRVRPSPRCSKGLRRLRLQRHPVQGLDPAGAHRLRRAVGQRPSRR